MGSELSTDPGAPDLRFRGRTYAISFDRVWMAALELAGGGLRGWKVVHANDVEGALQAEASVGLPRHVSDVRIRIGLDRDGQTRVDLSIVTRAGSIDLGGNRRQLRGFLSALDRKLAATPAQILDASRSAS